MAEPVDTLWEGGWGDLTLAYTRLLCVKQKASGTGLYCAKSSVLSSVMTERVRREGGQGGCRGDT